MLINDARSQIMLGLQHNPESRFATLHDHPLSLHTNAIERISAEVTAAWKTYSARELSAEERELANRFEAAYTRLMNEGIQPAVLCGQGAGRRRPQGADRRPLTR